jgi:cytoskeletal protein RodZ
MSISRWRLLCRSTPTITPTIPLPTMTMPTIGRTLAQQSHHLPITSTRWMTLGRSSSRTSYHRRVLFGASAATVIGTGCAMMVGITTVMAEGEEKKASSSSAPSSQQPSSKSWWNSLFKGADKTVATVAKATTTSVERVANATVDAVQTTANVAQQAVQQTAEVVQQTADVTKQTVNATVTAATKGVTDTINEAARLTKDAGKQVTVAVDSGVQTAGEQQLLVDRCLCLAYLSYVPFPSFLSSK